MTKKFCDICGQPAMEGIKLEYLRNLKPKPTKDHTKILVCVHFRFIDHPSRFGGPPDLCKKCTFWLIDRAADKLRKGMKG